MIEEENKMICETLNRIFRTLLKTNRGVENIIQSQKTDSNLLWDMFSVLQQNRIRLEKIESEIQNNNNKQGNFQLKLSFKQTNIFTKPRNCSEHY